MQNETMEPRLFLEALLKHSRINASDLSKELGGEGWRSYQSRLSRFLTGKTSDPTVATLYPIAKRFKMPIEALVDPDAAATWHGVLILGRPAPGEGRRYSKMGASLAGLFDTLDEGDLLLQAEVYAHCVKLVKYVLAHSQMPTTAQPGVIESQEKAS